MSVRTMARVWEQSQHAGTNLLMLLAIADFADDDGQAYPAVPTLALKCRMTARNANLILSVLRKSGELIVRQNEGPKGTNKYLIPLKPASPLKGSSPLKRASSPPEAGFPKPLNPASDEPSVNHQLTTRERPRRASCLPDDWSLPNEWMAWAIQEKGWTKDRCQQIASIFADHWRGKGEARVDWHATWRNWCRRESDRPSTKGNRSAPEDFASRDYGQGGKL